MRQLSLTTKLAIGFGLLLAMLAALGGAAYQAVRKVTIATQRANTSMKKKEIATLIEVAVRKQIQSAKDNVCNGDAGSLQRYGTAKNDIKQKFEDLAQL